MISYKFKSKTFVIHDNAIETPIYCTSPSKAEQVFRTIFQQLNLDVNQEHMIIVGLNSRGLVHSHKLISSGTETGTLCTPAQIFRAALILGAHSVVMCHNHPSGDPKPSREDTTLTRKCRQSGEVLNLPLSDHIILGTQGTYHSFRIEEGWDA